MIWGKSDSGIILFQLSKSSDMVTASLAPDVMLASLNCVSMCNVIGALLSYSLRSLMVVMVIYSSSLNLL